MTLSLTRFMCQRNIFNSSSQLFLQAFNNNLINNKIRLITIKVVKPRPKLIEDYDAKNRRLKRVQSPHLSIYKPELTSVLSITHRITGCGLAVFATTFGWGSLILPYDYSYYLEMIEDMQLSATTLLILKLIIVFPTAYHFANGFRHLFWDAGFFLTIKKVYLTGYLMLAVALGATTYLAML